MLKMTMVLLAALSLTACAAKSDALAVTAAFMPDPPTQGVNTITITVKDSSGNPVHGAHVKIATDMPSMSMKGPDVNPKDNGDGTYTATAKLDYSTQWSFKIEADADGRHGTITVDKAVP